MPSLTRLRLAFLLLIAAFLVLVSLAVASLLVAGQPHLAAVVATAGLAGVIAGAITYLVTRREEEPEKADQEPAAPPARGVARTPLCVQAMPVADLPPEYVEAVMKGTRARLSALKAQARESEPASH